MHRRKFEQIKTYSKIIKVKKQTGEQEEFNIPTPPSQSMQEQEPLHTTLKPEDFEDPIEDEFEEEQGWVSESDEEEVNE